MSPHRVNGRRRDQLPGRGIDVAQGSKGTRGVCSEEGCGEPHVARSWCRMHYALYRPKGGYPSMPRLTPLERFFSHVDLSDDLEGCDHWAACVGGRGYGDFNANDAGSRVAHKWIYEYLVGPVPTGLDLGHVCHDRDPECPGGFCPHRLCVNIWHLEPMTRSQNMRDGKRSGRTNVCVRGHEYDEANTWISKDGARQCRSCNAIRQNALQRAKRAAGWKRRGNVWVPPKGLVTP